MADDTNGSWQTSYLFSEVLGSLYQPEKHWTSVLRRRAGISPFSTDGRASASFTFAGREASVKIAEFLHEQSPSCKTTELWKKRACPPNFHFDIAVTPGDEQSAFEWTCAHIERVRVSTITQVHALSHQYGVLTTILCPPNQ